MIKHIRAILSISLAVTVLVAVVFVGFWGTAEPTDAQAVTDAVVITLVVDTGISITSPADANMSNHLGVSANTAVATTTWNVKTNDVLGYGLALQASTNPAMQQNSTTTVADYQTGAPNAWSVSNAAAFGYSAFGGDTATSTWGTDTKCSGATASAVSTTLKYKGFTTSAGTNVASRTATTTTAGVDTNVCYAVEQNTFYIPSGTYTATITATATAN